MRRPVVLVTAVLALAGCGADGSPIAPAGVGDRAGGPQDEAPATQARAGRETERQRAVRRMGAVILRRTRLRRSPGGAVVTTVGRRTNFRSRQVLAVVARRGRWLGVLHPSLGRGRKAGWIPAGAARVLARRYEIVIDRSALRGTLYRNGRLVQHFRVGVGRPGNATPVGRYAITDRLTAGAGSPYGCCILALTGSQPSLPQGWTGGDRIALHGGPARRVGIRTTSGCVTIGEKPLKRLFSRVTAGTRVTVVA
jgi:lipoprotein-anchoring transpeptidase ErfK/SrfK